MSLQQELTVLVLILLLYQSITKGGFCSSKVGFKGAAGRLERPTNTYKHEEHDDAIDQI